MNITRFELKGRAHNSKINQLTRKGYKPLDIVACGKTLAFSVDSVDEKNIIAFLDEMCYDYEIKKRVGYKHTFSNIVSNNGLFVGIIISIVMLIVSSLFVIDIDIIGVKNCDIEQINNMVREAGATRFSLIYDIDANAVENSVLTVTGVSSVSVEKKGVKVIVYVHEELPEEKINDYTTPVPVISEHDAIITRVVVMNGTPLVESGDTVYKGQTLIAPYLTDEEEEGDNPTLEPIRATGIVYGRVWYSESNVFRQVETITRRTGQFIETVSCSYIFDGRKGVEIQYDLYEEEQDVKLFNSVFPLKVTYTRYYELEEVVVEKDLDIELNNIVTRSYLNIRAIVDKDAEIIRYWTVIKELDNNTVIDVYLEAEQRIDDGGQFG